MFFQKTARRKSVNFEEPLQVEEFVLESISSDEEQPKPQKSLNQKERIILVPVNGQSDHQQMIDDQRLFEEMVKGIKGLPIN